MLHVASILVVFWILTLIIMLPISLCSGINYVGQQGELRGCHNDVGNVSSQLLQEYLHFVVFRTDRLVAPFFGLNR
jgi:hypothetical protein